MGWRATEERFSGNWYTVAIGDQQSRSVAVCAISLFHDYKSLYLHILLIVTLYSAPSKLAHFLKFSWSKHSYHWSEEFTLMKIRCFSGMMFRKLSFQMSSGFLDKRHLHCAWSFGFETPDVSFGSEVLAGGGQTHLHARVYKPVFFYKIMKVA